MQQILNNKIYKKLVDEKHHGINRYLHCYEVMKTAIKLYGSEDPFLVSGSLLHDFFFDIEKPTIFNHSNKSLINSSKVFPDLVNSEVNHIILSHMWPISGTMPRTKRAWCVNIADKITSLRGY